MECYLQLPDGTLAEPILQEVPNTEDRITLHNGEYSGEYIVQGIRYDCCDGEQHVYAKLERYQRADKVRTIKRLNDICDSAGGFSDNGQYDPESAHVEADETLLSFLRALGHEAVADAYEEVRSEATFYYS